MKLRLTQCLALLLPLMILASCAKRPAKISFQTPEETFQTWMAAAADLNLELLVSTYTSEAQEGFRKDLKNTSTEELKAMQRETKATRFKIEKVVYENDKAYVRVLRRLDRQEEVEVLTMILQNGHWKIFP